MKFNNKVYNVLKWIALILLPAVSTLIMSLGDIWGLTCKDQICLTIAAVDTFLGAILAISTASYKGEGTIAFDGENTSECVVLFNDEASYKKAQNDGNKIMLIVDKSSLEDEPKEDISEE